MIVKQGRLNDISGKCFLANARNEVFCFPLRFNTFTQQVLYVLVYSLFDIIPSVDTLIANFLLYIVSYLCHLKFYFTR